MSSPLYLESLGLMIEYPELKWKRLDDVLKNISMLSCQDVDIL